jgi:hypothetical protein
MTTFEDVAREIWGTSYPGITWTTIMHRDTGTFNIIGEQHGRTPAQRTIDMPAMRFHDDGFVAAIDEACSEIADELTGETHLAYLERIGPLNEPFPLACEHHFAPITKNRTGPCECVHCGLVSHNVIPSLP